jgi:hypothetical protein
VKPPGGFARLPFLSLRAFAMEDTEIGVLVRAAPEGNRGAAAAVLSYSPTSGSAENLNQWALTTTEHDIWTLNSASFVKNLINRLTG